MIHLAKMHLSDNFIPTTLIPSKTFSRENSLLHKPAKMWSVYSLPPPDESGGLVWRTEVGQKALSNQINAEGSVTIESGKPFNALRSALFAWLHVLKTSASISVTGDWFCFKGRRDKIIIKRCCANVSAWINTENLSLNANVHVPANTLARTSWPLFWNSMVRVHLQAITDWAA